MRGMVAVVAVALVGVVALAMVGLGGMARGAEADFLRLHITANSNSDADQAVKYLIKQAIVNELTPAFVGVQTREQALDRLEDDLPRIKQIADGVLADNGFAYTANVGVKREKFPTRNYSAQGASVTAPEGVYDALVMELGEARGDNWWCVVYPPLCFLENNIGGEVGVQYRSKLHEVLKRFF